MLTLIFMMAAGLLFVNPTPEPRGIILVMTQVKPLSDRDQLSRWLAWSLAALVSAAAIFAWGNYYQWHVLPFNTYIFFPVLGLLAFSIMWSHYMAVTLKEYWSLDGPVLAPFFRWSGYAVLVLICLHPGLLIYQRFRDGFGLPPHSYESYVAHGMGWITLLGTASLLVFLAFEFRRVFGQKSWWHYVADASDFAMLAIVYHGLRLGTQLQSGWFHYVWLFYFVTLVAALIYKYTKRYLATRPAGHGG